MNRSSTVIAFVALVLLTPQAAWGIVYGEPDRGEHPYVGSFVGLTTDDTGTPAWTQLCSGAVISQDVVLSASHCFVGLEDFGIRDVAFALDEVIDRDRDGWVDRDVELLDGTAVTHPRYGTGGASNTFDIAVFLLDDRVSVTPARLPRANRLASVPRDRTFTAVGYGTVRATRTRAWQEIAAGWRREKADQQMRSLTKAWLTLSMNQATGDGGTCYGDSGGPHLIGDVVVSLTVTGDRFCKATDKTYRVDTRWSRQFLDRYVDVP